MTPFYPVAFELLGMDPELLPLPKPGTDMYLSDADLWTLGLIVCELVPGLSMRDWKEATRDERYLSMLAALRRRALGTVRSTRTTADRDAKFAAEYIDGLQAGTWQGQADYLRQRHKKRFAKNPNACKAWFSKLLKRAEGRNR